MNISCLPVSIFKEIIDGDISIVDWAKEAKKIGYDGIDISVLFIKNRSSAYIRHLREQLEHIGMPIVMMTTYPDFTYPNDLQRQREMDYLISDIALASQLNVKYLRILAGQAHPDINDEVSINHVVNCFRQLDSIGEKYGVRLVFEDHGKPSVWDYFDFSYRPEIFLKIFEGIKDTNIRINYDTGNISAYGADSLEVLKKVVDFVETIHVSDVSEIGTFSPVEIGAGIVPNKEIFEYLKRKKFDGWLCVEEASNQGYEGIFNAFEYVKNTWENA